MRSHSKPSKARLFTRIGDRMGQSYRRVDADSEAIYALVFVISLAVALEAFTYYA